jgi:HEAT repeat protein
MRANWDAGFHSRAIEVLVGLRTPGTAALLLDLALGRVKGTDPRTEESAARGYIAAAVPGCSAAELLPVENQQVVNVALLALKGHPIDDALMEQLERILQTAPTVWVRSSAAYVLVGDRTASYAERKSRAIAAALRDLPQMDHSTAPVGGGAFLTAAEFWYHAFIWRLVEVWDPNRQVKLDPAQFTGNARDAVVIALSLRGDRRYLPELSRILQEPAAGMFGAWAAEGIGGIGTEDEIEVLTNVARSNETRREIDPKYLQPGRDPVFYPVRDAAVKAIKAIRDRKGVP